MLYFIFLYFICCVVYDVCFDIFILYYILYIMFFDFITNDIFVYYMLNIKYFVKYYILYIVCATTFRQNTFRCPSHLTLCDEAALDSERPGDATGSLRDAVVTLCHGGVGRNQAFSSRRSCSYSEGAGMMGW